MTEHMANGGPVGVSDSSEVTEVTPPSNTATFAIVAVLLLLTTAYLERAYNDARVTPPPRHVRIGPWRRITSNCHPRMNQALARQFCGLFRQSSSFPFPRILGNGSRLHPGSSRRAEFAPTGKA